MKIFIFIIIITQIFDNFKKLIFFNDYLEKQNKDFNAIKLCYKESGKRMFISFIIISIILYTFYFLCNFYIINNTINQYLIIIFNILLVIDMSNYTFYIIKSIKSIKNNSKYLLNKKFLYFSLFISLIFNMFMFYIFLFEVF